MRVAKVQCREIADRDIDAIAELLTRGFPGRTRDYWMRGLRRQSERPVPPGYPRYGYLLENDHRPVGALLLLYTSRIQAGETTIRCNVSSWYVDPLFRIHAARLSSIAQKNKDVTYINISPAVTTWPIIEARDSNSTAVACSFQSPFCRAPEPARQSRPSPPKPGLSGTCRKKISNCWRVTRNMAASPSCVIQRMDRFRSS